MWPRVCLLKFLCGAFNQLPREQIENSRYFPREQIHRTTTLVFSTDCPNLHPNLHHKLNPSSPSTGRVLALSSTAQQLGHPAFRSSQGKLYVPHHRRSSTLVTACMSSSQPNHSPHHRRRQTPITGCLSTNGGDKQPSCNVHRATVHHPLLSLLTIIRQL